MASVFSRTRASGKVTWHTKVPGPDGKAKFITLRSVKTERQAQKLADEIEAEYERRTHGLEPGALFRGTFAELCEWAIKTHIKNLRGAQSETSRLTCHVIGDANAARSRRPWIGQLPADQITKVQLERFFSELEGKLTVRGTPPSPGTINRLRLTLSSVFALAQRHGFWGADNPAQKTKERDVPERDYETLASHEIFPVLEQVPEYWRGCCAVALLAGLRKGEIFGLQKRDVDLERRQLRVSRSHQHATTKGGHVDTVPIHDGLVAYLEPWLDTPGPWLFPDTRGKQRSRNLHVEKILQAAMIRAGIVEGYRHKCRRKGCGFVEEHPDDAARACPDCKMRLWPVGIARHVRFHDARHTLASQALMAGASLAGVQAILRHKDPRLTIKRYGHLTQDFLADELNRFQVPGIVSSAQHKRAQSLRVEESEHRASERKQFSAPTDRFGAQEVPAIGGGHHGTTGRKEIEGNLPGFMSGADRDRTGDLCIANARIGNRPDRPTSHVVDFAADRLEASLPNSTLLAPSCAGFGAQQVPDFQNGHQRAPDCKVPGSGPDTAQLLTVPEVAERLSMSKAWVYRAIEKGTLAGVRIGASVRVTADALDAYLAFLELTDPPRPKQEPAQVRPAMRRVR